jgi:hypothetical protein
MARFGPKPGSIKTLPPHDTIEARDGAIGVLLSNRPERVWVDRADYERIVARFRTRKWTWVEATHYVRLRTSQTKDVPVARLVLDSDAKGRVWFADGDRLNLRRSNLSVKPHKGARRPPKGTVIRTPPVRGDDEPPKQAVTPRRRRVLKTEETPVSIPVPALPKPPPVLRPMPKREPTLSSYTTRVQPNSAVATVKRTSMS